MDILIKLCLKIISYSHFWLLTGKRGRYSCPRLANSQNQTHKSVYINLNLKDTIVLLILLLLINIYMLIFMEAKLLFLAILFLMVSRWKNQTYDDNGNLTNDGERTYV